MDGKQETRFGCLFLMLHPIICFILGAIDFNLYWTVGIGAVMGLGIVLYSLPIISNPDLLTFLIFIGGGAIIALFVHNIGHELFY